MFTPLIAHCSLAAVYPKYPIPVQLVLFFKDYRDFYYLHDWLCFNNSVSLIKKGLRARDPAGFHENKDQIFE